VGAVTAAGLLVVQVGDDLEWPAALAAPQWVDLLDLGDQARHRRRSALFSELLALDDDGPSG
jgi:hypothetical protein